MRIRGGVSVSVLVVLAGANGAPLDAKTGHSQAAVPEWRAPLAMSRPEKRPGPFQSGRFFGPGPASRVVCGMTMIPADPSIDRRMRVVRPRTPDVRHTIRELQPPICSSR